MTSRTLVTLALCAAAAATEASAARCIAGSGPRTLPLVELYTSEGCSSCPPADRWLARAAPPEAAGRFAALAFHVDYWDRLGWPDRFARASWSARQREHARAAGRSGVIYTPQVTVQGRDTTGWRTREAGAAEIAQAAATPPRAAISLEAESRGIEVAVKASARVRDAGDRADTRLVVAFTDGSHRTDVRRGENAGTTLAHEHVVREVVETGLIDPAGELAIDARITRPREPGTHPRLVAFVERATTREVLQSLVVELDACPPR